MMESHDWRAKQLEHKLPGPIDLDQLIQVAKVYRDFIDTNGERYANFLKLYEEYKNAAYNQTNDQISDATKAELVLAYEDDLVRHLENVRTLTEKADKVLDVKRWPDLSGFQERIEKLATITRDQHLQSVTLDSQTEELIEVYNDIINSFKRNAVLWNQKLEAYEMEDPVHDDSE
jgi:hypothetical protein